MSQLVKFGDVVENLNLTASDTQLNRYERVVGLEHIIPNELKIQNWDLMANLHEGTSFRRIFKKGHVLFGKRRAYQRKVALADFDGICSSDILVFSATKALLAGLLPYVVQSERFFDHANQTSSGSLSPRTRWQDLAKFTFELPSLDEQARIVELMTAVDEHLDALRSQLEVAKGLRAAVLHQLLSAGGDDWTETILGDVAEVLDRMRKPISAAEREKRLGIVPYYGATGQAGWIDKPIFDEDLVLLGEDAIDFLNPDVHKAYLISGPSWVNNHAHVLKPRTGKVLPFFLMESLNAVDYSQFVAFGTRSKLTQGSMMGISVNLPPISEQERIVEIVSSMDDVIQAAESAVVEAKNLRSGLLSDLLSGEHEIPISYDELLGAA